jgi:hypothetical protein
MAVPAELMAALQGGGGAAPMEPPMEEAPVEEAPAGSPMYGAGPSGGNVERLRAALDALAEYSQDEDDEQHVQTVLKCVTALQAILAEEQKMIDGALGGKADPRAMRRLSGGGGAGPSY